MNKQKILDYLKKERFSFSGNLDIVNLTIELGQEGLIDFLIEYRESENDSWLQAEYYSEHLDMVIIIDYNVNLSDNEFYSNETIATILGNYNRICKKIYNKLNK